MATSTHSRQSAAAPATTAPVPANARTIYAPKPLYPFKAWLPAPLYYLYRVIRTVTVAGCFAGFWGGSIVLGWVVLPVVWLWPGTQAEKIRRVHAILRRCFDVFHFAMWFLRLYHRTSTAKTLRAGGVSTATPCVLVANHPTLCDVTSIVSLFPNVVAVARPGFANNVLLRRLVRAVGFVPLDMHVMKACEDRLRMGFDVLVFPEGTRSPVGKLHEFHRGAFELARRAKVPIVLLKLNCEPSALSKRLPIWKTADHMAVLTIEPIETLHPASDSREMCRATEQRYYDLLGYPDTAAVAAVRHSGET